MATIDTWYVDPNATGDGDGTSEANAYTAAQTAENAKDEDISAATGTDKIVIFECLSSGARTADVALDVNVWTTAIGNYVEFRAGANDRAVAGGWDANKYRISVDNADAVLINDNHVRLIGLQIAVPATNEGGQDCIIINT